MLSLTQLLLSLSFSLTYPISYNVISRWVRLGKQLLCNDPRWQLWKTSGKQPKLFVLCCCTFGLSRILPR